MDSNETKAGPYTPQGDYNILSPNGHVTIFRGTFERDQIMKRLNAAYALGQASREQSPDMVDRVIRICKETLNAHGYDFPLDHDTPAMLDFRTHLTSLFKPQP